MPSKHADEANAGQLAQAPLPEPNPIPLEAADRTGIRNWRLTGHFGESLGAARCCWSLLLRRRNAKLGGNVKSSFSPDFTMALFSKHPIHVPDPQPVGYSVFDSQMSVDGDVETEASLRIDGRLRGNVRSAGVVVVAAGASVNGGVAAREVIVGGRITGNVTATERVELQESAAVTGDIEASAIMIREGGSVDGRLTIRPTSATAIKTDRGVGSGERQLQAALGSSTG